jgi:hypothetical protein
MTTTLKTTWKWRKVAFLGIWVGKDISGREAEIARAPSSEFHWAIYGDCNSKVPVAYGAANTLNAAKKAVGAQRMGVWVFRAS